MGIFNWIHNHILIKINLLQWGNQKVLFFQFNNFIGSLKPDTKSYRLRGTGSMGNNKLPDLETLKKFTYNYSSKEKRDPVPKRNEKPI